MKYFSSVLRWVEGGDCVRRWMIWGISASGGGKMLVSKGRFWIGDFVEGCFRGRGGCLRGSSIVGRG